ncbi:MAG: TonB-dependent receptor [Ignavibacteriaceae bacterium]|jgi:outer membrane receptor for ferrienterochelin and colicin
MRIDRQLFLCSIILFFLSFSAFSQTGKISGKITDAANSEGIPFVNVVVLGTTQGAASNLDGDFVIINLKPGVYSVRISAIGYNTATYENINVSTGLTTALNAKLSSNAVTISKDVVIVAERPMVQKDLTASTSIMNDELISELPVTEVGDLLQLQAGITKGGGGELHLRGGRSGQIAFQIDGVPITDAYDGSNVIDVSTNSIQELQVVSGAFNAEFGQAMSGIVNIVTKDGGDNFNGSLQSYVGDYVSSKNDKFWNINNFNPTAIRNFEGSLSGPILREKLFFFVNARYYYNTGYFYGKRDFLVTDFAREKDASQGGGYFVQKSGGGEYVPMNPNDRVFGQAKLTYRIGSGMRLSYNYILDKQQYQDYDGNNRLTPDNNLHRFKTGYSNTVSLNHALSASTFYTLNLSYFYKDYHHYLFENVYTGDPAQPTFYVDNSFLQTPPYSFAIGGTNTNRFTRNTSSLSAKLDMTSQLNKEISIQFGGEFKRHRLYYENINLQPLLVDGSKTFPYNVTTPAATSTDYDKYIKEPTEMSGYFQSKFEAFNLIFNAGVRLDVFNPNSFILSDPTDPDINNPIRPENKSVSLAERETYWYKDAKIKYQLSPRLGIAFPITDKGVIHFSYGHFFQLPSYELLYSNPNFKLADVSGNAGLVGNADLKPQKTVKGEIGLQQQIGEDIAIDVTMFFEDFRDLIGTQTNDVLVFGGSKSYSQYANSDFGFSKGIIVKFEKRFMDGLAINLDYTYAVTKGNASNPADARNAVLGGAAPETFITPLDWDQTHTLNLTAAYTVPDNFGFSLIANYYSGQPYTRQPNKNTLVTQNAFPKNSDTKPSIFNIDIRAYKDFKFNGYKISLFVKVFNLLDLDNPRGVYGDTGDPLFTFGKLDAQKINPTMYYNTLDELYTNPTFFSEPRRVELGASFNF